MTTLKEVRSTLPVGGYGTSIDLKDAYWHIPIHPYYRRFLGFAIGGKKYRFRVLPFGLNIAPRIFTKMCKPILKELRTRGILVLVYIDDWLIWGSSKEESLRNTEIVIEVLQRRGFLINFQKSHLTPTQRIEWLGILWDLESGHLSLPQDKVDTLMKDIPKFLRKQSVSRREIEKMLGKLQFASLVDPVGRSILKSLNGYLRNLARQGLRDRRCLFPLPLKRSLSRWLSQPVLTARVPFRPPPPSMDIFTDASLIGWGVHTSEDMR